MRASAGLGGEQLYTMPKMTGVSCIEMNGKESMIIDDIVTIYFRSRKKQVFLLLHEDK